MMAPLTARLVSAALARVLGRLRADADAAERGLPAHARRDSFTVGYAAGWRAATIAAGLAAADAVAELASPDTAARRGAA